MVCRAVCIAEGTYVTRMHQLEDRVWIRVHEYTADLTLMWICQRLAALLDGHRGAIKVRSSWMLWRWLVRFRGRIRVARVDMSKTEHRQLDMDWAELLKSLSNVRVLHLSNTAALPARLAGIGRLAYLEEFHFRLE